MKKQLMLLSNYFNHPYYTNYYCDDSGNVYGPKGLVKPQTRNNYYRFTWYKDGKKGSITYHKFIWECYNGLISLDGHTSEGYTIDHVDGNPLNNDISNLQVLSARENVQKHMWNINPNGIIGVHYRKDNQSNPYMVSFEHKHLGYVSSLEAAAILFDDAYETKYGIRPNNSCSRRGCEFLTLPYDQEVKIIN